MCILTLIGDPQFMVDRASWSRPLEILGAQLSTTAILGRHKNVRFPHCFLTLSPSILFQFFQDEVTQIIIVTTAVIQVERGETSRIAGP